MDFSVNTTRMPEQQNTVGRDVVSPVQEQAVTTNILPSLGTVADMLISGFKANQKADAEAQKQAIVGAYAKQQQTINDGVASGQISPDRAATQGRALFGKYIAGYSMYADDLHKINNAFRTGSELGVAEDATKAAQETQKAREASARSNGVTIYPWMDVKTKETMLQANEANIRSEREFKQSTERASEARAVSAAEQTMLDRDRKENALKMITDVAGSTLNSTSAFLQNLTAQVSQGKIPQQDAEMMLTSHFSTIEATIQASAGLTPELAAPYRSLFADMKKLGMDSLDPKKSAETSKAMFDDLMYKAKMVAVTSDPKMKAVVVANSLLGGNAVTALGAITPITDYIARASTIDSSKGEGFVPPIVNNPEVQKDVLKFLQPAIKKVNEGNYKDNPKALKEATTSVNNILKQTGDLQNDPSIKQDPKKLADLAQFFASPDYGTFVAKAAINPQAAQAAKQVWQSTYDVAVRQSVQDRVKAWETSLASQSGGGVKGVTFNDAVDVKYDGSGISFVPKQGKMSLEPFQENQREIAIKELNAVKAGINQSIHIGAHMEGTTDYNKYWEANKHLYLPSVFTKPVDKTTVSYKTDEAMQKAVVIKPSEVQPDTQTLASNLAEIDQEIANSKSKVARDVLVAYRKTLTGGK